MHKKGNRMGAQPSVEVEEVGNQLVLKISGDWDVSYWEEMHDLFQTIPLKLHEVVLDCKRLALLDSFGAWILSQFQKQLHHKRIALEFKNFSANDQGLLNEIQAIKLPVKATEEEDNSLPAKLEQLGRTSVDFYQRVGRTTSFLGEVVVRMIQMLFQPKLFRYKSFVKFIAETGIFALPIVGLISFMIGIVLVYQGASQLERFGAGIFTVNLMGISVLRELGILITSIVVAGRSGSAFTAQIGFMKLNQEVDAMLVIGLNPLDLLVIPRVTALIVALPLLTLYADFMGLIGGGLMSIQLLDLSWSQFLHQLRLSIAPWTFWTGMIKAPVFAFVIAFIGCYEGFRVQGGAEDVGRRTTRSVVRAIFMVMALDALFSIMYSNLGI
jgi:phospholipid/cholesterol/gamma-HCH transport system permease protein